MNRSRFLFACYYWGYCLLLPSGIIQLDGVHGFAPIARSSPRGLLLEPMILSRHAPRQLPTPQSSTTTELHVITPDAATLSVILRGGAEAALNLSREGLKLQSTATYSTITALIMNASLRLYTSQKFNTKPDANGNRPRLVCMLESLFTASTTLCIICGTYTAVLFNILGIYSKEALGVGNEAGYLAFQYATAMFRKWGFRSFLVTCLSFVICFLASVVEKTSNEDRVGQAILVASIILALIGVFKINAVLTLATKYIYTAEVRAAHHIA